MQPKRLSDNKNIICIQGFDNFAGQEQRSGSTISATSSSTSCKKVINNTQQTFTCSKSTIETLEKDLQYFQS